MDLRQPGGNKRVQHQMFPQHTAVLRSQMIPASRMAHQPRVESEHLGLRHDLAPNARRKWPHQMRNVRDLIDLQPVRDGGRLIWLSVASFVTSLLPKKAKIVKQEGRRVESWAEF